MSGENWLNKNWIREDQLYVPKRKVNNRGSNWYAHIIGSFYSEKMNRPVEYESLGERLFYYFLELDRDVVRYYVQSVEVPIKEGSGIFGTTTWTHISDVLVFRQESIPLLYQIKHSSQQGPDDKEQLINKYCNSYALKQGWEYKVIYPKEMPNQLSWNIRFLQGFLKERTYYDQWMQKVAYRMQCMESGSIEDVSRSFQGDIDPLLIRPIIYFLMARGTFHFDVTERITSHTRVSLNEQMLSMKTIREGLPNNGIQSTESLF
ncbi:hypothetical protein [Paenibacillus sp. FSL P2-0173]|uniref:hypothetical protein n=1 Tax=Paenibacillus sp. FSL P2-0173 TaxID=2921627 RepID=UPI0030FCFF9F